jgi:murein DD-endopeptidase MepM/ murein hydrolase activator NlpD
MRIFADTSAPEPALTAEGGEDEDDQFYGAQVDGEVSVKVSDFPIGIADVDARDAPAADEVEAIVRASLKIGGGPTQFAALPYAEATGDGEQFIDENPFNALGVSIVAENVSNVVKTQPGEAVDGGDEQIITIAKGQSFVELLQDNMVSEEDAGAIVDALSELVDLNAIQVGQKIRLAFGADLDGSDPKAIRVSIYDGGAHQATVARTDDNTFRRSDEPRLGIDALVEVETETYGTMPRVYNAIFRTALEQQVPRPLIDKLIRIFAFDVDYQARMSPGDSIEIFHSLPDENPDASEPEILYTALTLNGVTKRFYRFRTPDDGIVDYYDAEGKSAKKFLMRKPITSGVLRSRFGMRRHPILGYTRMHWGVDWAAPRGTPIIAPGNGVVVKAGWTSGYGKQTVIRHPNGYETSFSHQSKFANGIHPGVHVRQGQVIGYIGTTGLSTGPHLHYELKVNGTRVDPMRVRLPSGKVLAGKDLEGFKRERDRINALLDKGDGDTTVVAQANG